MHVHAQDDCFVPLKLPPVTLKISSHECDTTFFRTITCFHIEGTYVQDAVRISII